MSKFRKKPVVIEAFQITDGNVLGDDGQWPDWLQDAVERVGAGSVQIVADDTTALTVETLEGTHNASYGDWIIRGVKGELYPCKPDIFAATYEPAE